VLGPLLQRKQHHTTAIPLDLDDTLYQKGMRKGWGAEELGVVRLHPWCARTLNSTPGMFFCLDTLACMLTRDMPVFDSYSPGLESYCTRNLVIIVYQRVNMLSYLFDSCSRVAICGIMQESSEKSENL